MSQHQQYLETELQAWYDKYHFFRMEKINAHAAGQKFEIQQQLKHIQSEIQKLEQALAEKFAAQVDDCEIEQVNVMLNELGQELSHQQSLSLSSEQQALLQQLLEHLQAVDKSATAKLKIILPIIPMFLHYDLELDSESGIMRLWQRLKDKFKR